MAAITDPIMLDSTGQDIKDQISALNTKIQTLNTLLADLGLVSITPISQEDYDALSQAEKLAGVFDIYDAVEPDIDGTKVSYDNNTSVVEKIDTINTWTSLGDITSGGTGVDVSKYNTICILPKMQGWAVQNPQFIPKIPNTANAVSVYVDATYHFTFRINFSPSGVLSIDNESLSGWTTCVYAIYAQ